MQRRLVLVVLLSSALFVTDAYSRNERQNRGLRKLRLSTARGFGKRAHLQYHMDQETDDQDLGKRGFRKMTMSTARGFGKRDLPNTVFWDGTEDTDPNEWREKRGIRRLSLSTARGFGKRNSGFSEELPDMGPPNSRWLAEDLAKVAETSDDGLAFHDNLYPTQ